MNKEYKPTKVSVVILDYNRPKEAAVLMDSLVKYAQFEHDTVYLSNGGEQDYVLGFYKRGLIDTLVLNKQNNGCGLGTRQGFQIAMSEYVIYVQVDQFLLRPLTQEWIDFIISSLEVQPSAFYCDLAGNQGNGQFSERALLINRKRYLSIPKLDETIGGPGPWANYQWTENLVQNFMKENNLSFFTHTQTHFFADNGKWSHRSYPCGGETLHSTDEKMLRIIKPLKQKYDDFPNLKLTDQEWMEVLENRWPLEGKIPEADKVHSFLVWKE